MAYSEFVRRLDDDALVALLRARPDLAAPSPSTLRSLAARASSRTSLERALAQLDLPTLQALEAVLGLEAQGHVVAAADVAAAVGASAPDDVAVVVGLLDRARALALLWTDEAGGLRPAPGLPEVLGTAAPGPDGRTHADPALTPPAPTGARAVPPAAVDDEAASAAVEAVRLVDTLLRAWQDAPPPVLRAGGLGVRDLRRTALALEVDEATAASVVELAATTGLVDDDGEDPPSYVPTTRADDWDEAGTTERWGMLAAAWASGRRTPWLAGTRDEKGTVRAALSADLGRGWVPRLRTQVLTALASLGPVAVRPDDVMADLAWRTPRAVPPDAAVVGLLHEAALLGATGAGALATPGRALLALLRGDAPGPVGAPAAPPADAEAVLAGVLRAVLPRPSTSCCSRATSPASSRAARPPNWRAWSTGPRTSSPAARRPPSASPRRR
ncbi:hypothetical protein [Xylanimonas protaetiae]|uniref:hypothetical protein n=1 Tax=Xylanimonas protaetiae TaxID=2509457 RepID=UPI001F5DBBBB|nr:hypothetical protein [Xylanimonas protaetiae]